MSQDLRKRITIRLDEGMYEWVMKMGGAEFGRRVLEKAREKLDARK